MSLVIFTIGDAELNEIVALRTSELTASAFPLSRFPLTAEALSQLQPRLLGGLLLLEIYREWQSIDLRLSIKHFDTSALEVQLAHQHFLNTVSRHIQIENTGFDLLLTKAIRHGLDLILKPEEAFRKLFFPKQGSIPLTYFTDLAAYVPLYDFALQAIAMYHQRNELTEVEAHFFFEKLERAFSIYENNSGQKLEDYRKEQYALLVGRQYSAQRNEATPEDLPPRKTIVLTPRPLPTEEVKREKEQAILDEATREKIKYDKRFADAGGLNPKFKPTLKASSTTKGELQPTDQPEQPLAADLATERRTEELTQTIAALTKSRETTEGADEKPDPADVPVNQVYKPLTLEEIPLHKQFLFVQKLFGGSNVKFRQTLEYLSTLQVRDEADEYIIKTLGATVPMKDPIVLEEFLELVLSHFPK